MKNLVLYFSLDGHTEKVAEVITKRINADMEKITLRRKLPKGFFKYLVGGFWTISRKKPSIEPLKINLKDYDLIFLGTPVWASTYCPVFNSIFEKYEIKGKKIAIFVTYASMEGNSARDLAMRLEGNNEIMAKIAFSEREIKKGKVEEKIEKWLEEIKAL
jgi:flavodoxin